MNTTPAQHAITLDDIEWELVLYALRFCPPRSQDDDDATEHDADMLAAHIATETGV